MIVKMHALHQCVKGHRLFITYQPHDDFVSLEKFENVDRPWITPADWLVPIKIPLSVEDSEEESQLGNTQIPTFNLISVSQGSLL